jgi:hypothetical protein
MSGNRDADGGVKACLVRYLNCHTLANFFA